jgi:hypothetical protein
MVRCHCLKRKVTVLHLHVNIIRQAKNLFNSKSPYSHIVKGHTNIAKLAKRLADCLLKHPQNSAGRSWQKQWQQLPHIHPNSLLYCPPHLKYVEMRM